MWWVPGHQPSRGSKNLRMFEILPPERVDPLAARCLNQARGKGRRGVIACGRRLKHGAVPATLCRHGRNWCSPRGPDAGSTGLHRRRRPNALGGWSL